MKFSYTFGLLLVRLYKFVYFLYLNFIMICDPIQACALETFFDRAFCKGFVKPIKLM